MSNVVQYAHRGPMAVITLNRPDQRNALSRELIAALGDAFRRAASDPAVRCVVLTGNGKDFCVGMDLEEFRGTLESADDAVWDDAVRLSELYDYIYKLPKPTIAAVNGTAVAGGAGLVTVCDLAVASPDARFGYPQVRRGLVAAMVIPHLLRHVGERTARWLLLTGELIDSAEALRWRLINSVVAPDHLMDAADSLCQSLTQGGPKAIATTKDLLRRFSGQAISVEDLARGSAEPRLTGECRDGLASFFEKKPPPW
jgi:methylglutaconyl-CoA hydratase